MWMARKNRSLRKPRKYPWKSDFPIGRKTKKVPVSIFEKCPRHLRGSPLRFPKQCQRQVESVRKDFETRNFHGKKKTSRRKNKLCSQTSLFVTFASPLPHQRHYVSLLPTPLLPPKHSDVINERPLTKNTLKFWKSNTNTFTHIHNL